MKSFLELIVFYHNLLGRKLFLLISMIAFAACLEIVSVSFFMPLLAGVNSDNPVNKIFKLVFSLFNIEYTLFNLLIVLIVIVTLRSLLLVGETSYRGKIMAQLLVDLRQRIGRQIFELDYLRYLSNSSGFLNNALVIECQNVVFAFKMLASLMVTTFFAIAYLGIPIILNPTLVLILIVMVIVLLPILRKINSKTKEYSTLTSKYSAGLQRILIQALNNFKYLKATGTYDQVLKHVNSQSHKLGMQQYRLSILQGITQYGFEPFVALMIAGVVFYYVAVRGENITEYIFLLFLMMTAMRKILGMQQNLRKLLGSWGSIGVVKGLQVDLEKFKERKSENGSFSPDYFENPIVFKDVSFSFNKSDVLLKDINMEIHPNSTVAFVGESGVGKSTLVNLLIGLLEPSKGEIYLGETAYKDIDKEKFRKHIGYITQESVIFNDTIRNNVTFWNAQSDKDNSKKIYSVLGKARISEYVKSLRRGYDSILGEGGINISGGQRQRICIARELFKDAKVIVFDEATSALDTKTEKEIQKNIDEFRGEKTIILIAHRLSTVRNCDNIFVLKDGRIVEEGMYDDLLRLNGEFNRMVNLQNSKTE